MQFASPAMQLSTSPLPHVSITFSRLTEETTAYLRNLNLNGTGLNLRFLEFQVAASLAGGIYRQPKFAQNDICLVEEARRRSVWEGGASIAIYDTTNHIRSFVTPAFFTLNAALF